MPTFDGCVTGKVRNHISHTERERKTHIAQLLTFGGDDSGARSFCECRQEQ